MNKKASKKLKRLATVMATTSEKPQDVERIYKNLKSVYKDIKKAPNRG